MKKMEYRRPVADLILFENEDVVTTSCWLGIPEVNKSDCRHGTGWWHCTGYTGYYGHYHKCTYGYAGLVDGVNALTDDGVNTFSETETYSKAPEAFDDILSDVTEEAGIEDWSE